MTDQPLFAYGTLRDPDILAALLGHSLPAADCIVATAPGFRAVHFPARVYPALLAAPGATAEGLLLHGLTPDERAVLDAFEGDEYRRGEITVTTASGPVAAQVYLANLAIPPDAEPWTLAIWTRLHKPSVLAGETSTAAALRQRLTARSQSA